MGQVPTGSPDHSGLTIRRWTSSTCAAARKYGEMSTPTRRRPPPAPLAIGRVHVRIRLPQQYMFTAMNVLRLDLADIVEEAFAADAPKRAAVRHALDRVLDLELAIMLETYREDSETQLRRGERLGLTAPRI